MQGQYCRIKSQGEYGKERMLFLAWQIFFGKVKEFCLLRADLNNRKEADGTADCIKTGL